MKNPCPLCSFSDIQSSILVGNANHGIFSRCAQSFGSNLVLLAVGLEALDLGVEPLDAADALDKGAEDPLPPEMRSGLDVVLG